MWAEVDNAHSIYLQFGDAFTASAFQHMGILTSDRQLHDGGILNNGVTFKKNRKFNKLKRLFI